MRGTYKSKKWILSYEIPNYKGLIQKIRLTMLYFKIANTFDYDDVYIMQKLVAKCGMVDGMYAAFSRLCSKVKYEKKEIDKRVGICDD
jgi:hypothetical protein